MTESYSNWAVGWSAFAAIMLILDRARSGRFDRRVADQAISCQTDD